MKMFTLSLLVFGFFNVSYAEDASKMKMMDSPQSRMQMHEQMAKAHQDAADCMKAGKSEEDCRLAFHKMCKGSEDSEMCEPMTKHHKKSKMKE